MIMAAFVLRYSLEQNFSEDHYNEILRIIHTLKGEAGVLDLKGLPCPMPVVKISQEIGTVEVGEIIEVHTCEDPYVIEQGYGESGYADEINAAYMQSTAHAEDAMQKTMALISGQAIAMTVESLA